MTTFSSHLRELMKGATPEPWQARPDVDDAVSPRPLPATDIADGNGEFTAFANDEQTANLICLLRNAAPQIIAVVEAAELVDAESYASGVMASGEPAWRTPGEQAVHDALAALNSAVAKHVTPSQEAQKGR